jgi:hypothetical protein
VNENSFAIFKKRYGELNILTQNDFATEEKVIEPIFAATGGIGNNVNNIVTPGFYRVKDANNIEGVETVIRRLYWGGVIPCDSYNWEKGDGSAPTTKTDYPYVGSTDHPYNSTLDLGFGVPRNLFYKLLGPGYTVNNRYNERYKDLIEALIDKDSKQVTMFLTLTPTDIFNFSFRRVVYIIDSYYYVNSINGFNPEKNQSIAVDLIWLDSVNFIPAT